MLFDNFSSLRIKTKALTWCRTSFNCLRIVTFTALLRVSEFPLHRPSRHEVRNLRSVLLFRELHDSDRSVKQKPDGCTTRHWPTQHEARFQAEAFWCWCFFHWLKADKSERWSPSLQSALGPLGSLLYVFCTFLRFTLLHGEVCPHARRPLFEHLAAGRILLLSLRRVHKC